MFHTASFPFVQIAQLDEVKIRISALRAIIDLLLVFGFQLLSEAAPAQAGPSSLSPDRQEAEAAAGGEKAEAPEDSSQSVLLMLSEFLDSEVEGGGRREKGEKKRFLFPLTPAEDSFGCFQVSDLRTETAEGLAKLMYTGRMSSAKIFSRLVLLWYNPLTEDDTRLRHCLGVFFQLFARESRSHGPSLGFRAVCASGCR